MEEVLPLRSGVVMGLLTHRLSPAAVPAGRLGGVPTSTAANRLGTSRRRARG